MGRVVSMEIILQVFAGLVLFKIVGAGFAAIVRRGEEVKYRLFIERFLADERERIERLKR